MNKISDSGDEGTFTYDDLYAEYYDLLAQHKNYQEETRRLDQLIKSLSINNKTPIIDIGCGTGSHAIALATLRSNPISGFDTSKAMINKARSKNGSVNFFCGELSDLTEKKYGLAFSLFNVINCIENLDVLTQFFSQASRILKPNSYLIFEFWNKFLITESPPRTVVRTYLSEGEKVIRKAVPDNSDLESGKLKLKYEVNIVDGIGSETCFTRVHELTLFSFEDIKRCLEEAHFEIEFYRGALPELSPSTDTQRMTSILAKKLH
ncbi:MAG: methyltransferase domain-containing protein [Halieaceae bacterium]|nr:methyltransferase domain-containing protein [Halieaceae bacterium]